MADKDKVINIFIRAYDEASKVVGELQKNGGKLAEGFQTVGKSMMAIGAAGAVGLGGAVKVAADFEKGMSSVKAVAGLTEDQFKTLRGLALQLGKDTQFSAGEAAAGMEAMVKAGVSVENIMGGALKGAMDMAAAGEIGLADAAEIAATALATFKMKGEDIPKVADLLAGAANASATDIAELQMALQQSALVAADAGLSFADTATTLAVFAERGLRGSDAGTSLKTMLLRLNPQTKEASELMKQLGIITEDGSNSFYDASGNLKSMSAIAEIMKNSTKGLTAEQRTMALQTIFGTDAIRAANAMISAGAEGYSKMAAEMGKVSAADVAAERMNNLSGSVEMLKSSLETVAINIGSTFIPAIRGIADWMTKLANWFGDLSPATQELIGKIAAAASAFFLVGGALMFLVGKIPAIIEGVKLVQLAFAGMAGPIALVVAGIVALAAAWAFNVGGIRDKTAAIFAEIWPKIQGPLEQIGKGLAELWTTSTAVLSEMFEAVWPIVSEVLTKVVGIVGEVLPVIVEIIGATVEGIKVYWDFWSTYIWPTVKVALDAVLNVLKPALEFVLEAVRFFVAVLKGDWGAAWDALKGMLQAAWDTIVAAVKGAVDILRSVVQTFLDALGSMFSAGWEKIKAGFEAYVEAFKARWAALSEGVRAIVETLVGVVVLLWQNFGSQIMAAADTLFGWLIPGWDSLKVALVGIAKALWDGLVSIWQGLTGGVTSEAESLWSGLTDGWNSLRDAVVGAATWLSDKVSGAFSAVVSHVEPLINQLIGWYDRAKGIVDGISNFVSSAVSKVGELAGKAREAGASALSGGRAHGGDIDRTGLYLLHKGETVYSPMAASLAAGGSAPGGRSVVFAPSFEINGAQDPEAVAAAVERKVMGQLDRLGLA